MKASWCVIMALGSMGSYASKTETLTKQLGNLWVFRILFILITDILGVTSRVVNF